MRETFGESLEKTGEAWETLAKRESPTEVSRKLDALRDVLPRTGWPKHPHGPDNARQGLHIVATWEARVRSSSPRSSSKSA